MGDSGKKTKLAVLVVALALFAVLIAVVALGGGDEEEDAQVAAVPEECLPLWNDDEGARGMAVHTMSHGLFQALMVRVDENGQKAEDGDCAVVFQTGEEAEIALNVWNGKRWRSVAYVDDVPVERVRELQAEADTAPNVSIDEEGRLHPVGEG